MLEAPGLDNPLDLSHTPRDPTPPQWALQRGPLAGCQSTAGAPPRRGRAKRKGAAGIRRTGPSATPVPPSPGFGSGCALVP